MQLINNNRITKEFTTWKSVPHHFYANRFIMSVNFAMWSTKRFSHCFKNHLHLLLPSLPRCFFPIVIINSFKNVYVVFKTSTWCCCSMAGVFPIISVKMKCERSEQKKISISYKWEWTGIVFGEAKGVRGEGGKSFFRRRQKMYGWVVLFLCWMGFKHCGKIHNLIECVDGRRKERRKKENHRTLKQKAWWTSSREWARTHSSTAN